MSAALARAVRLSLCAAFLALTSSAPSASPLIPRSVEALFRFSIAQCGGPERCIIDRSNMGGLVSDFVEAARQIKAARGLLVIDAPCGSACTILADLARPRACITPRAVLLIHQSWIPDPRTLEPTSFEPIQYRPDVMAWIDAHGGEPRTLDLEHHGLRMSYREARRFFPACPVPTGSRRDRG